MTHIMVTHCDNSKGSNRLGSLSIGPEQWEHLLFEHSCSAVPMQPSPVLEGPNQGQNTLCNLEKAKDAQFHWNLAPV